MKKRLFIYSFTVLSLLFCLAGCDGVQGELKDTTGYVPVRVCVESTSYHLIMKKGILKVNVSYTNLSLEKCSQVVDLGRNPEGLFSKGDSLTMYLHPDSPDELRYVIRDLRPIKKIQIKKNT